MAPLQATREIAVSSPLGDDALLFGRMTATEELGRPFECRFDLLSEDGQVDIESILGENMTVRLQRPDGQTRYFNGFVTRFSQPGSHGRYAWYQATLRPWLWFLDYVKDFDFQNPMSNLEVRSLAPCVHGPTDCEFYDYPGNYYEVAHGEEYARIRMDELHAQHEQLRGKGDARGLTAVALFELIDYPRPVQNREYLVVSATHELESDEYESTATTRQGQTYTCTFSSIDSRTPFRPLRIAQKPVVQGPQTAIVVGKAGEEIWTDKYGRVKVQFHWDRDSAADENSSCCIRVSQAWANKRWGTIDIPRVGQEVIVDFLEGDPDRHKIVDNDHFENIGKDRHLKVTGKQATEIGNSHSLTVSGNVSEVFKSDHSEQTTNNCYLRAAGTVNESISGMTLKCRGSHVVIDQAGVTVRGATVTVDGELIKLASGPGSPPASGNALSAVSPAAPEDADPADKADPGEMAEVKAVQRQKGQGKHGSVPVVPCKPSTGGEEEKSGIEIELVDEENNPVPGEKYRITLPGTCDITFPELDKDAWDKA